MGNLDDNDSGDGTTVNKGLGLGGPGLGQGHNPYGVKQEV